MGDKKKMSRILYIRLALLSLGVLFLAGVFLYSFQNTLLRDVFAVPGSLTVTGGNVTYTTVGSTTLDTTNLKIGGVAVTATAAELNTITLKANSASPTFTGTVVLPASTSIGTVSSTELGYLDNVTSSVQTQINTAVSNANTALNLKANLNAPTFTGDVTMPGTGIWKSTGVVGIGTTNPSSSSKVEVSTTDGKTIFLRNTTAPIAGTLLGEVNAGGATYPDGAKIQFVSNVTQTGGTYDSNIDFLTWSSNALSNKMRIAAGGNVGIGTTAPAAKLSVGGPGAGAGTSQRGLQVQAPGSLNLAIEGSDNTGVYAIYMRPNNSGYNLISSDYLSGTSANYLPLSLSARETNSDFTILANGNVGIGTTAPKQKLNITTGVGITYPVLGTGTGNVLFGSDNNLYGLYEGSSTDGNSWFQVMRNDGPATAYNLILQPVGGNVGIGTTAPGPKLEVSGLIYSNTPTSNARGFSSWADNNAKYNFMGTAGYWGIRSDTSYGINFDVYNGGSNLTPLTIAQNGTVSVVGGDLRTSSIVAGYDYTGRTYSSDNLDRRNYFQYNTGDATASFGYSTLYIKIASLQITTSTWAGGSIQGELMAGGSNRGGNITKFSLVCNTSPNAHLSCSLYKAGAAASGLYFRYFTDAGYLDRVDIYYYVGSYSQVSGYIDTYAGAYTNISVWSGLTTDVNETPSIAGAELSTNAEYNIMSGNVGLGTIAPNGKLEIVGPNANTDGAVFGYASTDNNFAIQTYIDGAVGGGWANRVSYAGGCCNTLALQPDVGSVMIGGTSANLGATKLYVNGPTVINGALSASAFYYTSDLRQKKNVETLSGALDKVLQLRGVKFNWKVDGRGDIGVIAQEVEKVYPELVKTNEKGMKSVEYGNLVGPLIEAIKEQQGQINELKKEVNSLKEKTQ